MCSVLHCVQGKAQGGGIASYSVELQRRPARKGARCACRSGVHPTGEAACATNFKFAMNLLVLRSGQLPFLGLSIGRIDDVQFRQVDSCMVSNDSDFLILAAVCLESILHSKLNSAIPMRCTILNAVSLAFI
jgi:hypothetical protein